MKKTLLFFSLLFLFTSVLASIPDSLLLKASTEKSEKKRIDLLNKAGLDYSVIDINKSDSVLNVALNEAKQLGYDYGIAMAYHNIGEMHFHSGDYEIAITFIEKAIPIRKKINDNQGLGNSHLLFGEIHRTKGSYEKAVEEYVNASEFMEMAGDKNGLASLKVNFGLVYVAQQKYQEAKENFTTAAEELKAFGSIQHAADCYNNLAMVAFYEDDYNTAIEWLKEALDIYIKNENVKGQATSYTNIGSTYSEIGNYGEAEYYFKKGLKLYIQLENKVYEAVILLNMGDLYRKMKEYEKSKEFLFESLDRFVEQDNKEYQKYCYAYLSALFEDQQKYKKAMEYLKLYNSTKDSIINKANTTAIADMEAKYQGEAKQRSIEEKEKTIAQQNQLARVKKREKNIIIVSATIVLLIIGVFTLILYQRLKLSKEQKKKIEQKNRENELLLGEIHHRVKNNLQVISSLLSLQGRSMMDQTAKAAILEGKERVQSMGLIHKLLYQKNNYSGVEMNEYIKVLVHELLDSFGKNIEIYELDIDFKKISLDVDTAIPVGLIVNELVVNALKYAFEKSETPSLRITLKEHEQKLILQVADNGEGIAENIEKSNSFGMKLVKSLTRQISGEMDIIQNEGIEFRIVFSDYRLVQL